jgi:hypothetical protein
MTNDEQNIAVAEWCGWKLDPTGLWWSDPTGNYGVKGPPDYGSDLNATHEAEKQLLTGDGWKKRLAKYSSELMAVMHDTDFGRIDVAFKNDMVHLRYFTLHATAAQRREALLRTIGRWKEPQ